MKLKDYVIILKYNESASKNVLQNKKMKFKPFVIINDSDELNKNTKWFIDFLNNKNNKVFYFYNKNVNFKINDKKLTIDEKIYNQFLRDIKRCKFTIGKRLITNNENYEYLKKTMLKQLKYDCKLMNIICFLCSQTSLAFVIKTIHQSIMNSNKDYIIAEISDKSKFCNKRVMSIYLDLFNKNVVIEKYLRIIALDNNTDNYITIKYFKLSINFTIDNDYKINSIITLVCIN